MSSSRQPVIKTFIAGADLSAKQYYFVKIGTADNQVILAGANEKTVGILMNAPESGQRAEVAVAGGALLKISEAIDALELLTPTSTGVGEQCDAADEWCGAVAMEGGAANDVIEVEVAKFYASKSDA